MNLIYEIDMLFVDGKDVELDFEPLLAKLLAIILSLLNALVVQLLELLVIWMNKFCIKWTLYKKIYYSYNTQHQSYFYKSIYIKLKRMKCCRWQRYQTWFETSTSCKITSNHTISSLVVQQLELPLIWMDKFCIKWNLNLSKKNSYNTQNQNKMK